MSDRKEQLVEFHLAMGQPIEPRPSVPTDDRVRLRAKLIAEEFFETMASMFRTDTEVTVRARTMKQPSDFRQGVEAAAKWIRTQDSNDWYLDLGGLASKMLVVLDLDIEGTEARTVAQIADYLRNLAAIEPRLQVSESLLHAANFIASGGWKAR